MISYPGCGLFYGLPEEAPSLVSNKQKQSITLPLKLNQQEARSWWQRRTTYNVLLLQNGFREFLARGEAHTLLGWHLNGFLVAWIDASACRTRAHLEGAKTD